MDEKEKPGSSLPAGDGFFMPAEWSAHKRTWMCWPCRVEVWGSVEAMRRAKMAFAEVARDILDFEPVTMAVRPQDAAEAASACGEKVVIFQVPLNDSWARDIGPTFLKGADDAYAAVQWRFNAWGNKYDNYSDDSQFATRASEHVGVRLYHAPFICEGGAIHTDGEGTLITTEQTLLNANRNPHLGREAAENCLKQYTAAQKVIWLGNGFSDDETDGHIDNIACFGERNRALLGIPASTSHPDTIPVRNALGRLREARNARDEALEIVEIPQPRKMRYDSRGRILQASYINFYLCNGGVVMPCFDDLNDEPARAILADVFPARKIIQVDALDIVQGGGGIHCITQQEPA